MRYMWSKLVNNFTKEKWNQCLATKNWTISKDCKNVEEMVDTFSNNMTEAIDEVAPFKTFTVKSNYKFGISPETKLLMKQRDDTREKIKSTSNSEKIRA